ncbi:hypothetical protein JYT89_02460 [Flavobacteriaceae bacterium AH-315-B10]|nr:hypothetical protein [Flavobacteriaceae bacterium AH-315-B10]
MILKKLTFKTLIYLLTLALFVSCKSDKKEQVEEIEVKKDNAIEIVTRSMEFQTVDTITSGWNTFRYKNLSNEVHLILFDKYPEGKSLEDTHQDVFPPFDKGMELIIEGNMEEAMAEFGKLPEWFGQIVFTGGSGLISPKHTSVTTLNLKSGLYIMECYVKMPNGKFHASMGMVKEIWATNEDSGNNPPKADINITVSSTEGIQYEGEITNGEHIFSVYYKDQIVHEHFLGHDVNLVRLDENADLDTLEAWMNWATPTGLMTPSPEGVTFLGGTNDSPAGSTQYFKMNLEPGNYAFIAEVPNASKKGMLKTFTIK